MLVHVFDTLLAEEEEPPFLSKFLRHVLKASEVKEFRRDGEYLEIRATKRKNDKGFKTSWSSGMLYQKLRGAHAKRSLPVIWKMGRYFHGGYDVASETVRSYVSNTFDINLEQIPFTLERNGSLSTRCKISHEPLPEKFDPKKVKFTVDKQDLNVILLPHNEMARTLLSSLLKGFL